MSYARMRQSAGVRSRQRGFMVAYVIAGVALIAISTFIMARMRANNDTGAAIIETRDTIASQASLIRGKILLCSMTYPGGDNGLGYRLPMPAAPVSGLVADLECPGAPSGSKGVWVSGDGLYAPTAPRGLGAWSVVHDAASLRVSVTLTDVSPAMAMALDAARIKVGAQASITGSTLTIVIAS